jgi:hypothetical protein
MKRWQRAALAVAIPAFFLLGGQTASAEIVPRHVFTHSGNSVDLDGDGTTDFTFSQSTYPYYTDLTHELMGYFSLSTVSGNTGNSAIGYDMMVAYEDPVAIPLAAGDPIGPGSQFATNMNQGVKGPMVLFGHDPVVGGGGLFDNYDYLTDARYLGVRFLIDGESHYGWLQITGSGVYSGAYETISGQGITAGEVPEPVALPVAAGAMFLIVNSRRRRTRGIVAGPLAAR